MQLNDQQEKVVANTEGPVMVISCAGSGKTTVILERVKKIIDNGVLAQHILVTTFSKAAAEEMEKRFEKKYQNKNVKFSTIHSVCYSILVNAYNINATSILKVSEKKAFLLEKYLELEKIHGKEFSGKYKDFDDYYKDIELTISGYMAQIYRENIADYEDVITDRYVKDIYGCYIKFKKKNGKLDYDDMIIETHKCLKVRQDVAEYWQSVFRYITIDEFQDTSILQSEIFYILAGKNKNICVVGDDDQSIYSFRNVDGEIFSYFLEQYPDAKQIYMETNYRSCKKIISLSERLIKNNKKRFSKSFYVNREEEVSVVANLVKGDAEQTTEVINQIKKAVQSGKKYNEIAILYRVKKEGISICNRLQLENIPFYTKELPENIHSSMVYQDIKAYYRLANDIWDVTDLSRIINRPMRYIKPAILPRGTMDKRVILFECTKNVLDGNQKESIKTQIDRLFLDLDCMKDLKPHELMLYLRDKMKYREALVHFADFIKVDATTFLSQFDELLAESERFETMAEWNSYVEECKKTLMKNIEKNKKEGVFLSTFHGAKGLEWDSVFIISANEGTTPLMRNNEIENPEEERRLFYVAMTRAMSDLRIFAFEDENAEKGSCRSRYFQEIF